MEHNLRVYNTLTRQKESFKTVVPDKVGMYVCGPTVYKPSHLGHMVGPVIFDTVKRYLVYLGYEVKFVVNITDIDDKLIMEAPKQGISVSELAERVTRDYVENLKKLNVTGIDEMPRATHHIGDIVDIIKGLIDKGYAYPASGDVYFDVAKDDDYGKLCNRDPEQLEAGARIEISDKKRSPGDFALWKSAKAGEPFWDSPWGKGRPGWHIECSAMSMKLLGKTLDIHGGGLDLQFPHHENELAQSESFNGCTFVNYWMHNGLMKIDGAKVSKTKEEEQKKKATLIVSEVLKKFEPETIRFFLLATHYRRPINYSEEHLEEVQRGLDGFYRFFERYERISKKSFYTLQAPKAQGPPEGGPSNEFVALRERFLQRMDDDFNTGGAIGVLYELLTALNRFADKRKLDDGAGMGESLITFEHGASYLKELSQLLGIFLEPRHTSVDEGDHVHVSDQISVTVINALEKRDHLVAILIKLRAAARKAKNFSLGDRIRNRLAELGVTLEDRASGTTPSYQRLGSIAAAELNDHLAKLLIDNADKSFLDNDMQDRLREMGVVF
jgi:cysteinyl-tRNA synthetase